MIKCHWIYLLPVFVVQIVSLIILLVAILNANYIIENSALSVDAFITLLLVFIALSVAVTSRGVIQWVYTVYIVTTKKVMVTRLKTGLKAETFEAMFDLVKSVEHVKPGVMANLLNYGHIKLSTDHIASNSILSMRYIRDSEKVMKVLDKLVIKASA